MRETKFRAYNKEKKEWLDPKETVLYLDGVLCMGNWKLDREKIEVMQYTGLKDKENLTDIYEGDIIDMEGNIRGNIYESPEVYKALSTCVVAGMGYEEWENTKQRLVRQGKLVAEQSNLPQILRGLG